MVIAIMIAVTQPYRQTPGTLDDGIWTLLSGLPDIMGSLLLVHITSTDCLGVCKGTPI